MYIGDLRDEYHEGYDDVQHTGFEYTSGATGNATPQFLQAEYEAAMAEYGMFREKCEMFTNQYEQAGIVNLPAKIAAWPKMKFNCSKMKIAYADAIDAKAQYEAAVGNVSDPMQYINDILTGKNQWMKQTKNLWGQDVPVIILYGGAALLAVGIIKKILF